MRHWAAWVMQARHRQVLMIAALFLMPPFRVFSVGVATAVVIAVGAMAALPTLATGFGIVLIAGLVSPVSGSEVVIYVASVCVGAIVLGEILRRSESLTLTLQVSALIALLGAFAFQMAVADPTGFWITRGEQVVQFLVDNGAFNSDLDEVALFALVQSGAPLGTSFFVGSQLYFAVLSLMFGYYLFDTGLDKKRARFGRFRDVNLGRVLAVLLVIAAVGAALSGNVTLTNLAMILLLVFGVQGFSLLHWVKHQYALPVFALVACYLAVLVLPQYAFLVICVAGYVDAWFNLVRSRRNDAAS